MPDVAITSRKSVRLKGWDYASPGHYFVTICTQNRQCLFGTIASGELRLSKLGVIAIDELRRLPNHYDHVSIDCSVVMPTHVHAVIVIEGAHQFSPHIVPSNQNGDGSVLRRPAAGSLSAIVRSYKAGVTRVARIQCLQLTWQSGFYEHIITSNASLNAIREYIEANPRNWESDKDNPHQIIVR